MNSTSRLEKDYTVVPMIVFVLFGFISHIFAQTIAINWDNVGQEIDGFGASAAFKQADNLKKFPEATRTKILDLLFSPTEGIGLSMVRNMVGDGSMSEWGNEIDGPVETINPQKDTWNFKAVDEQIWFMKEAEARGCTRFFSTVWSPPRWMKNNNSCINGGSLNTKNYGDYAEYLYQYVTEYMEKQNGIKLYAVSVANEPGLKTGYSSCLWDGNQFRTFIGDHLGPKFRDEHKLTTRIIVGEDMDWSEGPALATLNDPKAVTYLDIVGSHNYNKSSYPPLSKTKSKNKRVWQTEVSNLEGNDRSINDGLKWAKQIHDFLSNAEGNSWSYWWAICYKVNPEKGEGLININTSNKTYFTNKRLYTMGNYSRFVRPGWRRISTSASSSNNVFITAFKNPQTNDFALVVINNNGSTQNRSFSIEGHTVSTVTPYVTSESSDLVKGNDISISNNSFSASLPAKSVTTFYSHSGTTSINRSNFHFVSARKAFNPAIILSGSSRLTLKDVSTDHHVRDIITIYSLSGKKLLLHKTVNNDKAIYILPQNMYIQHRGR